MKAEDNAFFATQINQNNPEPEIESPSKDSSEITPERTVQVQQQSTASLRTLLNAFNSYDKDEKGMIDIKDSQEILKARNIPTQNIAQYHNMSLPMYVNLVTFDEFLFVFCLSQNISQRIEDKYELCKNVDSRLVQFLKLLNNYRKKSEKSGNYKDAKNSKKKIEQIRSRQLERRNKYLKILYEKQIEDAQRFQQERFAQFNKKWDSFMNQYEATASDLVKKVKEKHLAQLKQFEDKTRQQLASKMHFSKYILELQLREKNLVKLQEYEKASIVQAEIQQTKARQIRQKELSDQQTIQLRLKTFKKQQESIISTLLQKIQKDRNDHMKQRQSQTEKMVVRNKSQLTDIDHRFSQTLKKIYDSLHNLGLESDKAMKTRR